ncbi:MAG: hypothetical protein M3Y87_00410 [Myxococcota bacterium]|nr:hypothetical protein [Myxococcota bacterium]
MLRPALTALFASTLLAATPARADYDRTGSLRAASTTRVELAREHVALACDPVAGTPDELDCALHVRWELRNSTEEALTANILLTWPHETAAQLTVAGAAIAELPTLRPVTVIVAPGASTNVELRATLRLAWNFVGGNGIPGPLESLDALHARHPLLSQGWQTVRRGFVWVRPDDLRFASVGRTTARVRLPDGWYGGGDLRDSGEREGGARIYTYESPEETPGRYVALELSRGNRDFLRHGGPFLALGGTIDAGFRGRLGYEIGIEEFVLVSIAIESDFDRQVIVTPQVEVASWGMVLIPSLSLGVGVPIRVTNDVLYPSTAGLRIEASATFFAVAFVATLDVWPNDGTYQLTLLGRIGL